MNNTFVGTRGGGNVTVEKITFNDTLKKILVLPVIRILIRLAAVVVVFALVMIVGRGAGALALAGAVLQGVRLQRRAGYLEVRWVGNGKTVWLVLAGALLLALAGLGFWPVAERWGIGAEPACLIAEDVSSCAEWLGLTRLFIPGAWSNVLRLGEHTFGPWMLWARLIIVIALPWAARLPFMDTEWISRMEQLFSKVPEANVGQLDPAGFPSPNGIQMRNPPARGQQPLTPTTTPDYDDVPLVITGGGGNGK